LMSMPRSEARSRSIEMESCGCVASLAPNKPLIADVVQNA